MNNVVTKEEGGYMDKLLERFLQYVSLDTQSKPGVRQVPSTEGQWKLYACFRRSWKKWDWSM
jgi:tripeptide aminopeptidase